MIYTCASCGKKHNSRRPAPCTAARWPENLVLSAPGRGRVIKPTPRPPPALTRAPGRDGVLFLDFTGAVSEGDPYRRTAIRIGGSAFTSARAVDRAVFGIAKRAKPGAPLSGDETLFLYLVLFETEAGRAHLGSGLTAITVEENPRRRGDRTFVLHRTDGTRGRFVWKSSPSK